MNIDYFYLDPTGNITIIVTTPVERGFQPAVGSLLMKKEPLAEQVGFLETDNALPHMQMAGGEFCGNATMSAAASYCRLNNLNEAELTFTASGTKDIIDVSIKKSEAGYSAKLVMPGALSVEYRDFGSGLRLPVVDFGATKHIVIDETKYSFEKTGAEKAIVDFAAQLKADCLGLMFLNNNILTPLVYVPKINSLFWESSCASGTTAVGEYFAFAGSREYTKELQEPCGTLKISAAPGRRPVLSGSVQIKKECRLEADIHNL